ncbi:MAG: hypothetical protein HBSAPP03_22200 [Phycisphaerae bacterium]|nr:MAG: hypothetical protein HBSAPP03_22200 [Phycisphaerae bacterium]
MAALLLLASGTATAQPPQGERPAQADRPREGVLDPENLLARLERRLADSKKAQEQLQTAIERLRGGASPAEALRDLDLIARGPWGERGEGFGGRRFDGEMDPPGGPMREGPGLGEPPSGPRDGMRPGEGRGERRGEGRGMGQPMTDEAREWATTFLRENLPTLSARMDAMRQTDPAMADAMLGRLLPKLRDAARVKEQDPDLAKLRLDELRTGINVLESIRVLRQAREATADDPKREAGIRDATAALRSVLAEQHDVRMRLQSHEIQTLTKRLEDLRAELERKRSNREAGIDDMLRRIIEFREPSSDGGEPPRGDKPGPRRKPE